MPRQVDDLRSGVPDQPGQHGETPSLLKIKKLAWRAGTCNPSYSGRCSRRTDWTREVEVAVSLDCAIALQPGWQEQHSVKRKRERESEKRKEVREGEREKERERERERKKENLASYTSSPILISVQPYFLGPGLLSGADTHKDPEALQAHRQKLQKSKAVHGREKDEQKNVLPKRSRVTQTT